MVLLKQDYDERYYNSIVTGRVWHFSSPIADSHFMLKPNRTEFIMSRPFYSLVTKFKSPQKKKNIQHHMNIRLMKANLLYGELVDEG